MTSSIIQGASFAELNDHAEEIASQHCLSLLGGGRGMSLKLSSLIQKLFD